MERSNCIKNILWDINITVDEAEELLQLKKDNIKGITADHLYLRILTSFN